MDYLPLEDSLPLRVVNKYLKGIVDSTFQRHSTHPQEKFEADLELKKQPSKTFRLFGRVAMIGLEHVAMIGLQRMATIGLERVQNLVSSTSSWIVPQGNPFLLGHAELWLPLWEGEGANLFRLLISRFGHHISSLSLRFVNGESNEMMVDALLELLSMNLPNLKRLKMDGWMEREFVSILRRRIEHHPLPDWDKLEALDFRDLSPEYHYEHGRNDVHVILSLPFLKKYGTQLKEFHCN